MGLGLHVPLILVPAKLAAVGFHLNNHVPFMQKGGVCQVQEGWWVPGGVCNLVFLFKQRHT